jgi:hypothetical protein
MYANGKMRPVETIQGMGEERIKNDVEDVYNYDYKSSRTRTFVNVTMYTQHNNNKKNSQK